MAKSIFRDKAVPPDPAIMEATLKKANPSWDALVEHVAGSYADFTQTWKYYGAAWGWSLVLKSKAKTLCYLTPADGHYFVSIIFNDKGRVGALEADLPEEIAKAVDDSKHNAKNIPYDFDVRPETNLDIAKKLIAIRAKT